LGAKLKSKDNLIHSNNYLPYDPNNNLLARELRKNMTPAERHLWYGFLSGSQPRFLRQKPIDHYIVDFYCPTVRLVIELEGDVHGSDEQIAADKVRSRVLEGYGVKVIRFTNEDVMKSFDQVVEEINLVVEKRMKDRFGYSQE
jgi:very-short-patch-repair endonuclease